MKQEIQDILRRVKNNDPTLTKVEIDNSDDKYYEEMNSEPLVAEFIEALRVNGFIKTLVLKGCFMDGERGVQLCNALLTNTSVTELSLENNMLEDKDAEVYANLMANHSSIKHYNFDNSCFNDKALEYFAEAIKNNKIILGLILTNGNEFSIKGIRQFFDTVKQSNIHFFKIDRATEFRTDEEWNEYEGLLRQIERWVASRKTPASATISDNNSEPTVDKRVVLSAASPSVINTRLQPISTTTLSQDGSFTIATPLPNKDLKGLQLLHKSAIKRMFNHGSSFSDDESDDSNDNNSKRSKHR